MSDNLTFQPDDFETFARACDRRATSLSELQTHVDTTEELSDDAFGRIPFVSGDLRSAYTEMDTVATEAFGHLSELMETIATLSRTTGELYASAEGTATDRVGG